MSEKEAMQAIVSAEIRTKKQRRFGKDGKMYKRRGYYLATVLGVPVCDNSGEPILFTSRRAAKRAAKEVQERARKRLREIEAEQEDSTEKGEQK